jgi:uncharacterized membrane protein
VTEGDERLTSQDAEDPPWAYRGRDLGRILSLSDGVFAFAMTLLVLGLVLPINTNGGAVGAYLQTNTFHQSLYAYVITFFVISMWWQGHHLIFSYLRRFDRNLMRVNTTFLVFMAVLPFATIVLGAAGSNPVGVGFFAGIQVAAGLTLAFLWVYASGVGHLVREPFPKAWRDYVTFHTLTTPILFGASILVALYSATDGELVWLGIFIVPLIARRHIRNAPNHSGDHDR